MKANTLPTPRSVPWLRHLVRFMFRVFYRFKAEGLENLPTGPGPVLLASNHQSYLDPVLVAIGQEHPLSFMAWAALFKWKPFGNLIRRFGAFPVDLDRLDVGAFKMALECLRAGQWVVIFPEGGVTLDGSIQELREGAARLALHAGAPIVPVRIEGSFEAWPKPRKLPHLFGSIKVSYGPPIIPPKGKLNPDERTRAAESIMAQLRAFLEQKSIAPPPQCKQLEQTPRD